GPNRSVAPPGRRATRRYQYVVPATAARSTATVIPPSWRLSSSIADQGPWAAAARSIHESVKWPASPNCHRSSTPLTSGAARNRERSAGVGQLTSQGTGGETTCELHVRHVWPAGKTSVPVPRAGGDRL